LAVFLKRPPHQKKEKVMEAKLYVGNLSYETTEDHLRELFMQAGGVVSVALIKDPTATVEGVRLRGDELAGGGTKGDQMFNGHTLGDRQLNVNVARPREERGGFRPQNRGHRQNRGGGNRRY
jgi:cold-inducible RNA-binding protein